MRVIAKHIPQPALFMETEQFRESKPYVLVDGKYVLVDDTDFIDIAEGFDCGDLMTFAYMGKIYESVVFIR